MNELDFKILNTCSGKTYDKLVETFGKIAIDKLIKLQYIVKLPNGVITRTEDGVKISKPLDIREDTYKDTASFNLLTDSAYDAFNEDNQLNS